MYTSGKIIDVDKLLMELKTADNQTTQQGLQNYDIQRLGTDYTAVFNPSLGIKLPFNRDDGNVSSDGYAMINGYRNLVKQNFINLMLTAPGEKLMDINFGVGLRSYLFENNTPSLRETLRTRIQNQVRKYMNFLQIDNISFSDRLDGFSAIPVGENFLRIKVDYFVRVIQAEDTVDLGLMFNPELASI